MRRGANDERNTAMAFERRSAILHISYPASSCSLTSWTLRLYSSLPCANRSAVSLAFADRSLYLDDRHVVGISVCHCPQLCTRQCRGQLLQQLLQSVHSPHCTRANQQLCCRLILDTWIYSEDPMVHNRQLILYCLVPARLSPGSRDPKASDDLQ